MKKTVFLLISILTLSIAAFGQDKKLEKLTAEELIKRHVASIGTPEDIAAIKTRIMSGEGALTSRVKEQGRIAGTAQFASEGNKLVFAIVFNNSSYPYEKVAFDGKSQFVGLPNGRQTALTDYLRAQNSITEEGLLGGVISTAWPLLDMTGRKAKLEATTGKIDKRQLYKLKYVPKGEDVRISLYFDPETYRHIRTEYEYDIQAKMAQVATESAQSKKDNFTMIEDFGDFKTFEKLTLPTNYQITVTVLRQSTGQGVVSLLWTSIFDKVFNNQAIDPESYKVS